MAVSQPISSMIRPTSSVSRPTSSVRRLTSSVSHLSSSVSHLTSSMSQPTMLSIDNCILSTDWVPWALTGVFAVLFLSTSTTTIVLAVLVWRRKEPPKTQFELEANPSYSCPKEDASGLIADKPETSTHLYDTADLVNWTWVCTEITCLIRNM